MAKLFSTLVVNGIFNAISRRGYSAAASASRGVVSSGVRGGAASNAAVAKQAREETKEKVSWVPDPVTGCYRPENCGNEIDVAELRAVLLKKN
ncbi:protein SENESCENCE-ASSOCIATED GENE 21, mitochondrial [Gossypium raimondii]|uniref:Uncharacterized protein n=1 Tax=Gossypium raimondii TaxID=29730 RepID=A0A0D2QSA7_GOSRA|nr:protein SENESCENCE-ASSOCIATED GENE 21, mitochondrial [Gossypium raimondii]KJB22519.1 hypothetical protein B456_004G052200 [Gossypium raimondii]